VGYEGFSLVFPSMFPSLLVITPGVLTVRRTPMKNGATAQVVDHFDCTYTEGSSLVGRFSMIPSMTVAFSLSREIVQSQSMVLDKGLEVNLQELGKLKSVWVSTPLNLVRRFFLSRLTQEIRKCTTTSHSIFFLILCSSHQTHSRCVFEQPHRL
jgi:hypothetical protein